jgi:F-type H+-transporting ATPase subunit b
MQIDWFTVVAQIINFLILVALLKYFLYDRIINMADERERKIAERFQEAEQIRQQAQQEAKAFQGKRHELEKEHQALIAGAEKEAETRRHELLARARREAEETRSHWHQSIEQEKAFFLQELRRRAGHEVYAVARRALADLADVELEQRIIDTFIERLQGLAEEQRAKIAASMEESGQVTILSAFKIPPEKRRDLLEVVQRQFGNSPESQFDTSPDVICGVELKTNGHKIAWSLENYLETLEDNLSDILQAQASRRQGEEKGESNRA